MLTVKTKDLKRALENAKKVINPKTTLPVLETVAFVSSDGNCWIEATDLQTHIQTTIPCEGLEDGFTISNPLALLKAIKFFGTEVSFELHKEDYSVTYTSGKKSGRLLTINIDEFPPPPRDIDAESYPVDIVDFYKQYKKIKPALSTEEARPALNCVYVEGNKMVASDGFVMSVIPLLTTFKENFLLFGKDVERFNVFGNSATSITHKGTEDEEDYRFEYEVSQSDVSIYGMRAEKYNYPDYTQLVPKEFKEIYTVNKKEFLDALAYLKEMTPNGKNTIYDAGTLTSRAEEDGEFSVKLSSQEVGNIKYSFSYNLAMKIVKEQFHGKTLTFKVNKHNTPIVISCENEEDGFVLLMPMHLPD